MRIIVHEFNCGHTSVAHPYDEAIIERVKQIPRESRTWHADRKVWVIDQQHVAGLVHDLETAGHEVVIR